MNWLQQLHGELTKSELVDGIQDLKVKCQEYRETYEVSDPDELAIELEADDGEGWTAVSRWRTLGENRKLAQAALALYDFDPDTERGDDARRSDASGAFAGESSDLSA